ncbi:hypothetical protein BBO99_00009831 [Phytophthora kernoviae]|uniref:Uncharacterized protein n=1 Tax=Phytophthora kernoviae TaxID=325452 RepID=A0A3R7JU67_9STRA|nr:hypothetical protein BBI17_009758 [Phytophthora kernoviae]RLN72362.1 hypothetical protein BBO99_00009831 [Phytophthora kernoviae]
MIETLKAAAAGNGANAVKAAEKLKAMELKVGNGVMSAKAVKKEARMFKVMLDAEMKPKQLYQALSLDLLGSAAIHTNAYKLYQRIRLQTAKMDR